jgi:hypothetical protein
MYKNLLLGRSIMSSSNALKAVSTTIVTLVFSSALQAAVINGDFSTGDFTGWQTDTDGFVGSPNDFSVIGNTAQIAVDHFDVAGDTFSIPVNDAWFANTLYQGLDLTANPSDQLELTFDWNFSGEMANSSAADYFVVGLNDGSGSYFDENGDLGFLIDSTTTFGSGTFTATLDSATYANSTGWFLDFQLNVGVDALSWMPDGYGTTLEIDNVSLEAVSAVQVPEPSSLALLGLGLAGLASVRRRK